VDRFRVGLLLVLGTLVAGAGLHPAIRAEALSIGSMILRADVAPVRDYLLGYGWWAPAVSVVLQVVTSVIAPLPSFILAIVNAMLFGFWWGALLTFTSAMLAAAICYSLARVYGRPLVTRFVPARVLDSVDHFFIRRGVVAVLVARLIPFINPDVVSYAAGLSPMRWRGFMLGISAGSIPSTALYSFLGMRGATSIGWLLIPLVGLGLLAFLLALNGGRSGSRTRPSWSRRFSSWANRWAQGSQAR
jgi:uncharacterized membrane protein YdjX (TVP38/TMEM64 family)